jgi:hypothetical protein
MSMEIKSMSDGKPRRGSRESVPGKVISAFPLTAQIVPLPAPPPAAEVIEQATQAVMPAAIAPIAPTPAPAPMPAPAPIAALPPPAAAMPADPWHAMIEAQTVLGRGYEQALAELTGTANTGMAVSRDAAVAMLGAKSVLDAVAIGNDLMRKSFDAMFDGAAKLSEIGVKTFGDASRPLLSRPLLSPLRS